MDVTLAKKYGWKSNSNLNDAIIKTYDDYCMLKKIIKLRLIKYLHLKINFV